VRTLGIVPARAGSTRLPGKNTRLLGGRPLVVWAIEAALAAERIDVLVVSSDDPEVLGIAAAIDATLPLARPQELAGTFSPAIDYVTHALETLEGSDSRDPHTGAFDAVAIVQPTSPFTEPATIDAAITLLETTGADSTVSVVRLAHDLHPSKMKLLEGDRLVPYVEDGERRQFHELAEVYVRNGSVYVSARPTIESGVLLGTDSRAVVVDRDHSVDINDGFDFEFAEFLLARRRHQSRP